FVEGESGLPKAVIRHELAAAEVYLHGGHVAAFSPAGAGEVLWMSEEAVFAPPKPIRGGVPVCWPWFGPKEGFPQHGFARNRIWQVRGSEAGSLTLGLSDDEESREVWPHAFDLELSVTVGARLQLALRSRNTGVEPIEIGGALHTYFTVGAIDQIAIHGLEDCEYLDSLAGGEKKRQDGPVRFAGEVDRIYLDRNAFMEIDDPVLQRRIRVSKEGSATTVVWNPWVDKSAAMGDFPNDGYKSMVCIETTNAADDVHVLQPGGEHVMAQIVELV
ncbi:MAG: D-hexose-6-phosphate mutarotase, partial [Limisphaerales bacterium]